MDGLGINRNILECKAAWTSDVEYQVPVLIETYWNVKSGQAVQLL